MIVTIILLGFLFQCICLKAIQFDDLPLLYVDVAKTLVLMEAYFPRGFFDIMLHLMSI